MSAQYIPSQGPMAVDVNQPLVMLDGPACGKVQERWHARAVHVMGVILLLIGVTCIALNAAEIAMHAESGLVSHGIWCGILYIVSGAFAIAAGSRKTFGLILTCMVLSIISAIFAIPVVAVSIVGLIYEKTNWYYVETVTPDPSCCQYGYEDCCDDYFSYTRKLAAREALHGLMLSMGIVQSIFAICTAICCCHAVGCCAKPQDAGSSVASFQGNARQLIVVQGTSGYLQAVPHHTQGMMHNSPQPSGAQVQGVYQSGQQQRQPVQPVPPVQTYSTQHMQPADNTPPPAYQSQAANGTGSNQNLP